jgi:hypothetical protein
MTSERDGVLIGRLIVSKYATEDDIEVFVTGDDGMGGDLSLIDALGLIAYAQHHTWDSVTYDEADASDD